MNKKVKSEVLAIIPARAGSKGIAGKNLAQLSGKPLIQYTIDAGKSSRLISRLIISSDDDEIIEYCKEQGIEIPFKRPKELAQDDTPMIDVIKHAVVFLEEKESYRPHYIVILQPTSPLRTSTHIDEALGTLINSDADSTVSVMEVPHQFNPYSVMKWEEGYLKLFLPYDERKNLRHLKPKFYARNGAAIYAFTYKCLVDKDSIYGEKILSYFMGREESVDIDSVFDLQQAEILLKNKQK